MHFQASEDLFDSSSAGTLPCRDIEDSVPSAAVRTGGQPVVSVNKRKRGDGTTGKEDLTQSWKDVLGPPPPMGNTKVTSSY